MRESEPLVESKGWRGYRWGCSRKSSSGSDRNSRFHRRIHRSRWLGRNCMANEWSFLLFVWLPRATLIKDDRLRSPIAWSLKENRVLLCACGFVAAKNTLLWRAWNGTESLRRLIEYLKIIQTNYWNVSLLLFGKKWWNLSIVSAILNLFVVLVSNYSSVLLLNFFMILTIIHFIMLFYIAL